MKCLVFFYFWFSGAISIIDASLTWSTTYHLKAVLTIPSANVSEPYEVWFNGETGYARVDFYNGIDKMYKKRLSNNTTTEEYYKVHPETTETFVNKQVCYKMDIKSLATQTLDLNSYLPIKDFKFVINENVHGIEAEKWEAILIDQTIKLKHIYTVWIYKYSSSIAGAIPIRYIYQIKLGETTFDYFHHDYKHYEITKFADEVYRIPDSILCSPMPDISDHEPIDPLLEFVDPLIEHSRVTQAFERFKLKHSKQYRNEAEHLQRMYIFKNNLRFINSINRQHRSFSLAVNHLVDRTDDELSILLGTSHTINDKDYTLGDNEDEDDITFEDDTDEEEFNNKERKKKSFDWRDYGAVTPIKDQTLLCGSCYALTMAAAIESAAYISRGCKYLDEVSEQAIIDCSWSTGHSGNVGCSGGTLEYTLNWAKKRGLPLKKEYGPYLAMDGLCHNMNMTKLVTFQQAVAIKHKKLNIMNSLRKYGPIMAAIDARPRTFSFYSGGIYDDTRCRSEPNYRNHGVTIIGYGRESDKEYWIIKNSYGTGWGENGYMRLDTHYNLCGITNFVYNVLFKMTDAKKCFAK